MAKEATAKAEAQLAASTAALEKKKRKAEDAAEGDEEDENKMSNISVDDLLDKSNEIINDIMADVNRYGNLYNFDHKRIASMRRAVTAIARNM
jgi:hypothetical protein